MKYELTRDLETGNAIIDGEHRELFRAVSQLMDSCSKGQGRASMEPAIQFLLGYVEKHFSHEERLQQNSRYPGYTAHKTFHTGYRKTLGEIVSQIPATGPSVMDLSRLNQHIAVLINHIRIEDKKLSTFLNQA